MPRGGPSRIGQAIVIMKEGIGAGHWSSSPTLHMPTQHLFPATILLSHSALVLYCRDSNGRVLALPVNYDPRARTGLELNP
ncbi:hypothetical protein BV898_00722 [Hypsibius exemplaris]|uniref:Uncharacterized protein n=1 Tax=Hypsibius exemplaris TaxID=2072580 RepID=A0A1W0XEB3_HYPEX|nr:hypothetical protein BV898_00722 [Hypsibius exemplaris]